MRAPSNQLTSAAVHALAEYRRLSHFMDFFFRSAGALYDRVQTVIAGHDEFRPDESDKIPNWTHVDPFLSELVLARAVDTFVAYVVELLTLIYETKPEVLRSAEQERLDFILQFTDMPALVRGLAEKRVNVLSYKSLADLAEYLKTKIGFELFPQQKDLERAVELMEIRNLLVHARGVVSKQSAKRCPKFKNRIGEQLVFRLIDVAEDASFLVGRVSDIDARARKKFSLAAV